MEEELREVSARREGGACRIVPFFLYAPAFHVCVKRVFSPIQYPFPTIWTYPERSPQGKRRLHGRRGGGVTLTFNV